MHKNGNFANRMVMQQENRDMEDSDKTVINEHGIEKENGVRLILYSADLSSELPLDFADGGIRAGFPSPAQDYMTESIDLNRELVRHPATTFYARAVGDSMKDCGIDDGDLLVIDKAIDPQEGDIVVAYIDGEFTLKRVKFDPHAGCLWLMPANKDYPPIKVTEENNFIVWGVLTYNIKRQYRRK